MTVAATCPGCGEHLRAVGTYTLPGGNETWLACDTCGLSWSEGELDVIDAERERAAGDAGEPGVDDPPDDLTTRVMAALVSDDEDERELRAAHKAIWSKDDETGWPEWDSTSNLVIWNDGDGLAQTWGHCMHDHGDAAAYARYIAAADPTTIAHLLAEIDGLRAEVVLLSEAAQR